MSSSIIKLKCWFRQIIFTNPAKWTLKNYSDVDVLTYTIVSYADSYASNIKFDKSEIINFIYNFDKNNFDIEKDYSDLFNMIDSLGNTVTNNIVVKDLSAKSEIGSLKSFDLKNLNKLFLCENMHCLDRNFFKLKIT